MADIDVKVAADTTQVTKGLAEAESRVQSFAKKTELSSVAVGKFETGIQSMTSKTKAALASLEGAVGPALAAFGAFQGLKGLFDNAGRIEDMSIKFGMSAESVQRMEQSANQSGVSIDQLGKALNKSEINASKAVAGNVALQDSYKALGLSAEQYLNMSVEERQIAIAKAYEESTNKAETLSAMVDILGKAAVDLIPHFAQGSEAIKAMMDGSIVASSEAIAKMDELGDKLGSRWQSMVGVMMEGTGKLLDMIDAYYRMMVAAAVGTKELLSLKDPRQAMQDVYDGAKIVEEERKAAKEKKSRKVDTDEIEKLQESALSKTSAEDTLKAKEDADKAQRKQSSEALSAQFKAAKEQIKAEEKAKEDKAKTEQQTAIDQAQNRLQQAQGAKGKGSEMITDDLRRIGGGYTKADYSGTARAQSNIQKQLSLQQKQVDYLKQVVDTLKSDTSSGSSAV